MLCNIAETYINFMKKNINEYFKMILGTQIDKKITTEFINTYIDARYYNYVVDDTIKVMSKRIFKCLKEKQIKLTEKFPKKTEVINQVFYLFKYIFYIDGVKKDKEITDIIVQLSNKRNKILKIDDKEFYKRFYEKVEENKKATSEFLKKFNTEKFELIIEKYRLVESLYDVSIKSNVKFKDIYKEEAIEKVFNSGLIAEDKLIIEYSLIVINILQDIIKGRFNKKYTINYTYTLLGKKRKNTQILNILNSPTIQDKLILKIGFKQFIDNRFDIYDLMKRGFRFAINVEKDNNIENVNLNMFKYILVDSRHKKAEKYVNEFKNVIIV